MDSLKSARRDSPLCFFKKHCGSGGDVRPPRSRAGHFPTCGDVLLGAGF
jgi:hypothetical protein